MYQAYCSHRNRATGRCDPSVTLLAVELKCTFNHASDMKRELVRKGWIRRLGRSEVELLVGEFPRPKVAEISGSNHGKFRDSTTENSVTGRANHGKFRDSITEFSVIHIKDEPVVAEPVAAAASAAAEPVSGNPLSEPVDEAFVEGVIEARVYPDAHVRFVWDKLRLHCKAKRTEPVKRQFLIWLATERHRPQQELPFVGSTVGEMPARAGAVPQVRRCERSCPQCFGTGFEVVAGKGARKCPNMEPQLAEGQSPMASTEAS